MCATMVYMVEQPHSNFPRRTRMRRCSVLQKNEFGMETHWEPGSLNRLTQFLQNNLAAPVLLRGQTVVSLWIIWTWNDLCNESVRVARRCPDFSRQIIVFLASFLVIRWELSVSSGFSRRYLGLLKNHKTKQQFKIW